jgi:D-sedoheptulose 7-phosphate isomerase
MESKFLKSYFDEYRKIFQASEIEKLLEFSKLCIQTRKKNGKIIFAGNGASASISSQAATDFTQHSGIRTMALNDHNLISAFGNDYGYEYWVENAINFYADTNDLIVLISSSGKSPNIINAAKKAIDLGCNVVTFTGFEVNNSLKKLGSLNFWVDSNSYNHIENTHLSWILLTATFIEKNTTDYYKKSLAEIERLISQNDVFSKLEKYKEVCIRTSQKKGKVIYAGNGGSASLSSHAAVDFTKQSKIRSVSFNDHNLLTCFANDYGQENWIKEALKAYADENDSVVLASCSGKSKNVLIAADYAIQNKLSLITFTGFLKDNPLSNKGDINFWVDSKDYSVVQSVHSIWIFTVADWLVDF